jgi:hypothetical protein
MKKAKQDALVLAIIIIVAVAIVAYVIVSAKPGTWQLDTTISNAGYQDTTPFTMNNTWRIAWVINKQNDNLFTAAVYMKNGTGYSWVTDCSEMDTNTTQGLLPVPYTGTFVIRVVASNETEWTLLIWELVPS